MELSFSPDGVLIIAACALAILLGGLVKGTLGVGLPLLAVPLMSLMIGSTHAIALVAVPVLAHRAAASRAAGTSPYTTATA